MKSTKERVNSILKKRDDYMLKKKREGYTIMSCIMAVLAIMVGTTVISPNMNVNETEQKVAFESLEEKDLITFASKEELVKAMKNTDAYKNAHTRNYGMKGLVSFDAAIAEESAMAVDDIAVNAPSSINAKAETETETGGRDYSETNTQVQGVDEADIVKTNGDYIYFLSNNVLRIFDNTGSKLSLKKEINFNEETKKEELKVSYNYNSARELYLTDEYIIVMCNSNIAEDTVEVKDMTSRWYYPIYRNSTKMMIYDASTYELVREVETEGSYVSSRKVDDDIYLITDKYVYYSNFNEDEILPLYKDTCVEEGRVSEVAIDTVRCFPSFVEDSECSYLIITSLSLDNIGEKANVETFLGTGEQVYCSRDNLYVTKTNYHYPTYRGGIIRIMTDIAVPEEAVNEEDKTETIIRKFAIFDGEVKYVAEGTVPGTLLNQFSMDEYQGYFRITTTKGDTWNDTSVNNLYVLDEKLNVCGKIEGLAKGERIYSTRFMGDKAYVVTYKTVDPLFVLDLSNPKNPTVMGELKIPGYSSYLHPLGDHYLIGFGEDSVEKTYKNYDGTTGVTAYSVGLKLAIFDVSDLENPKELDSVRIGGRGSYSELLHNHKSLLFKEDEGIFAFPANLYEENAGTYEDGTPKYGKQEFNGFLVFHLSVEDGITLKGKIGSESKQRYGYDAPQRIIYIDNNLYSIFGNMIKVNDKDTIKEVDKITFETNVNEPYLYYID